MGPCFLKTHTLSLYSGELDEMTTLHASRSMVVQFLGVTSGCVDVTITKFFCQLSLLNVTGLI